MAKRTAKLPGPARILRAVRDEMGVSSAEFARLVEIDPLRYWRMENGKLRVLAEDMEQIAAKLKRSVGDLYGEARAS